MINFSQMNADFKRRLTLIIMHNRIPFCENLFLSAKICEKNKEKDQENFTI